MVILEIFIIKILSIDVDDNFKPIYVNNFDKEHVISELKQEFIKHVIMYYLRRIMIEKEKVLLGMFLKS